MNKRFFAAFLVLITVLLSGCQLAGPEAAAGQDRLVGVLVTTEYLDLFDMESYFNDHAGDIFAGGEISGPDMGAYQSRLYGTLTPTGFDPHDEEQRIMKYDLTFPVEGFYRVGMYLSASGNWGPNEDTYYCNFGNGGFSDVKPALKVTDGGTDETLELTMAFCRESVVTYYANPVYQTSDGRVYATAGMGMTADLADGGEMASNQSVTSTTTREGKEMTETTTVIVHAIYAPTTQTLTIRQMDEENNLLSQDTYFQGSIPEEVDLDPDAAYLIVESGDGKSTDRQLCQRSDTSVRYYISQGMVAVAEYVRLNWKE